LRGRAGIAAFARLSHARKQLVGNGNGGRGDRLDGLAAVARGSWRPSFRAFFPPAPGYPARAWWHTGGGHGLISGAFGAPWRPIVAAVGARGCRRPGLTAIRYPWDLRRPWWAADMICSCQGLRPAAKPPVMGVWSANRSFNLPYQTAQVKFAGIATKQGPHSRIGRGWLPGLCPPVGIAVPIIRGGARRVCFADGTVAHHAPPLSEGDRRPEKMGLAAWAFGPFAGVPAGTTRSRPAPGRTSSTRMRVTDLPLVGGRFRIGHTGMLDTVDLVGRRCRPQRRPCSGSGRLGFRRGRTRGRAGLPTNPWRGRDLGRIGHFPAGCDSETVFDGNHG